MKPQRLVLKIGTNVLQRPNGKLDYNQISEFTQLVAEIRSQKHEVLIISSGAVGAGRELCQFDSADNPYLSSLPCHEALPREDYLLPEKLLKCKL